VLFAFFQNDCHEIGTINFVRGKSADIFVGNSNLKFDSSSMLMT